MVIAVVYVLVGMLLGGKMGASGDHTLSGLHAHLNLVGFTLMMVFGLTYRSIPSMAEGRIGVSHFWLHQIGALVMMVSLYLLFSETVAAASIGPFLLLSEVLIIFGIVLFGLNLWRNAR